MIEEVIQCQGCSHYIGSTEDATKCKKDVISYNIGHQWREPVSGGSASQNVKEAADMLKLCILRKLCISTWQTSTGTKVDIVVATIDLPISISSRTSVVSKMVDCHGNRIPD